MIGKTVEKNFKKLKVNSLNSLQLAYIGDAIYEAYIRNYLIHKNSEKSVHKLHKMAVSYVKAESQSNFIKAYKDNLKEEEILVFKRGRNAKSLNPPRNADIIDYRNATGLEALIGYLYLNEDEDRIDEIINDLIVFFDEEDKNGL
ncbi:MAG: Mini-ribonuclease 3 [Clostridiaceae bacterium]